MIQIYAHGVPTYVDGALTYKDNVLTYDSRLEDYDLQGLKVTTGLNKGGIAEITMPPSHPAYDSYKGFRTIVEVYRDGVLRFRGRALYHEDDYNNTRTVVCEGELCFLQDGIARPHKYGNTTLASILQQLIEEYNNQVDGFKQFRASWDDSYEGTPGTLEIEEAETTLSAVNKLLESYGGYLVITTEDDCRCIRWCASEGGLNTQTVDGENLLSFSRSGANSDVATAVIPYGAKDETTGNRLTVANANAGSDVVVDEETAAIYGRITKTVTWDDVDDPITLLAKAQEYLNNFKLPITSLTLTALDLSYLDKSIESFKLGDRIRVTSNAHGVDTEFQLVETSEDLLNPANNVITLGKELRTLTGLDVAGDSKSQSAIKEAVAVVKSDTEKGLESVNNALNDYAKTTALNEVNTGLTAKIDALAARIAALEALTQ